jgi:hypothetical protein
MFIYSFLCTFHSRYCVSLLFCVLFVCKCVLYYYHRVCTQLQSTNISFHNSLHIVLRCSNVKRIPKQGLVTVGYFSTFYSDILQTFADWMGITVGQIVIFLVSDP